MNMQKDSHPIDVVESLHVPRKEERREHLCIQDSIDISIERLGYYKKSHQRSEYKHQKNTDNTIINKTKITRKKWDEKQLYGQFQR